jgi:hypothetical protein
MESIFIDCTACRSTLTVPVRELDGIYQLSAEELSGKLRLYVSGVGRFFVVSALTLFWFPFLPVPLAIAGFYMTRRDRKWRRWAAVSVILTIAVGVVMAGLILLDSSRS